MSDAETVVRRAADLVEERYAFPAEAGAIAAAVRGRLSAGEFAESTIDRAFARRLTALFRDLSGDKHMGFAFFDDPQPMRDEEDFVFHEITDEDRLEGRCRNCGFHAVTRLAGNIGYIDLREFVPAEVGGPTADAAMGLVADTEALIIDLRRNDGGRQDMVAHIAGYLFDEPVQLSSRHNHITGETTHHRTSREVAGRRSGGKPLYVLTSRDTFSAGEAFAYDLKHLGRAILVGETTAGGANPTKIYTLTPHVWMAIPYGWITNPITGTNWEGVGVSPDVEIDAERALDEAHRLALLGIRDTLDRDWPRPLLDEYVSEVEQALCTLDGLAED